MEKMLFIIKNHGGESRKTLTAVAFLMHSLTITRIFDYQSVIIPTDKSCSLECRLHVIMNRRVRYWGARIRPYYPRLGPRGILRAF